VVIWLTYKPDVRSLATEQMAQAEAGAIPAPSPALSAPAALPSAAPSQEEKAPEQEKPADTGDSAGAGSEEEEQSGGGQEKEEDEPAALVGDLIVGEGSNRCITVPLKKGKAQDGTALVLQDCDPEAANQRWDFRGDGTVRSMDMCMDVAWGSVEEGALIQLARCSGNPAQTFVTSAESYLVNPQSEKCVDAMWSGTANGTGLHLWKPGGTPNQKWQRQSV